MSPLVAVLSAALLTVACGFGQAETPQHPGEFVNAIGTPHNLKPPATAAPVVIAIIDDGVRITHRDLRDFIWRNPAEIPGNGLDDDGNGYRDDIYGWDVGDNDNGIEPPAERPDFYHGTHLVGVMVQAARHAYGDAASDLIKIMPVKSIADSASTTYLKQGYKGIEYAIEAGADIILTAWGQATISDEETRILRRAADKGILIIASVGNFPEEREQFPAAYPSVVAVTAMGRDGSKSSTANFGPFVDLAAPGEQVSGSSVSSDDGYEVRNGTSSSAAMVAVAAAILKVQHRQYSAPEIAACLMSSAQPLRTKVQREQGKMGAGKLDIRAAIDCSLLVFGAQGENVLTGPKGYLRPAGTLHAPVNWVIEPPGDIKGIRLSPVFNRQNTAGGTLEVRRGNSLDADVIASYMLPELPESIYVAGDSAHVTFTPQGRVGHDWLMSYESDAIDSRTRYCSGTTHLSSEGQLDDGSGAQQYSYGADCKWLITAPPGKVVQFSFSAMDTESRNDMVLFFNGAGTHEQIMAVFSGAELPPALTTWSNRVLVWFVTDGQNQRQGWRAEYRFVDEPVQ